MLTTIAIGLYIVALLAACASDLTRYEIPNEVSLAVVAAFILVLPTLPPATSAGHLLAALAVFLAASLLFAFGVWGGGDAKLMAATALWVGWRDMAAFLLLTALAGAALALALLALRRILSRHADPARWYGRLLSESEGVPYGVAIAAAGVTLTAARGADALPG